jgi:hypothetical protein
VHGRYKPPEHASAARADSEHKDELLEPSISHYVFVDTGADSAAMQERVARQKRNGVPSTHRAHTLRTTPRANAASKRTRTCTHTHARAMSTYVCDEHLCMCVAMCVVVRCAELEQYISNADLNGDGIDTPVVTIVIGGDPKELWTLREVVVALEHHNPVVVLGGSGGTADDICSCWVLARQAHSEPAFRRVHESR